MKGILKPSQSIERTHLLFVSSPHSSTKRANLPPTGISVRGKICSGNGWLSELCGRRGLFRGGEMSRVTTLLSIVLSSTGRKRLGLSFRPVRLWLVRSRWLIRLSRSFKQPRNRIRWFLLLYLGIGWGRCQKSLLLRFVIRFSNYLIFVIKQGFCIYWSIPQFVTGIFQEAIAASRLAWNNSVARMVDILVEWWIDLATASKSLDKAVTDMDSCWRHK